MEIKLSQITHIGGTDIEGKTPVIPMNAQFVYWGDGVGNGVAILLKSHDSRHYIHKLKFPIAFIKQFFSKFSLVQVKNGDNSPERPPPARQNAC